MTHQQRDFLVQSVWNQPEEAVQFDEEMFLFGVKTYFIGRLSDFASTDFATARDNSSMLPGRVYYVDVLNATGERVYSTSLHGKKTMEEFENAMTRFCPGIQLKEHSILRG